MNLETNKHFVHDLKLACPAEACDAHAILGRREARAKKKSPPKQIQMAAPAGCGEVWISHSRYESFSDLSRTGKVTDAIIAESSRSRRLSRSRRGVDFYIINKGGVYLTLN